MESHEQAVRRRIVGRSAEVDRSPATDLRQTVLSTPEGWMGAVWSRRGLSALNLPERTRTAAVNRLRHLERAWGWRPSWGGTFPATWKRTIGRRLAGRGSSLPPLDVRNGTIFERNVWRTLVAIPRGQVRSYAWVAGRVGSPRAVRAVGRALGRNPLPLLMPCHRVVRTGFALGGFSGPRGWKVKLLKGEGCAVVGNRVRPLEKILRHVVRNSIRPSSFGLRHSKRRSS